MRDQFQTLSQDQQLRTLFVSCSDSRIDPSLTTQTERAAPIRALVDRLPPTKQQSAAIQENVLQQLVNPKTHPIVVKSLGQGAVDLHPCIYDIASGDINIISSVHGK